MPRRAATSNRGASNDEGPRKPLYAELSPAAYEAWQEFAGRYGLSVTAVLEAIGNQLLTTDDWKLAEISQYPEPVKTMLEHARVIGQERRRRKR